MLCMGFRVFDPIIVMQLKRNFSHTEEIICMRKVFPYAIEIGYGSKIIYHLLSLPMTTEGWLDMR